MAPPLIKSLWAWERAVLLPSLGLGLGATAPPAVPPAFPATSLLSTLSLENPCLRRRFLAVAFNCCLFAASSGV